ncbi:MAG TPA: hypothetical protein VHR39_07465 [Propionibacteriaceae bacterium]|nr:hypothetical protein [Propionibacteriaceae bacterium]
MSETRVVVDLAERFHRGDAGLQDPFGHLRFDQFESAECLYVLAEDAVQRSVPGGCDATPFCKYADLLRDIGVQPVETYFWFAFFD